MNGKLVKSTVLGVLLFTLSSFTPQATWACGGTFRPNCGQTAWLAKFVTSSIVLPGTGASITVPIGVLPYVLWNPASPCAQPNSSALELTLTCTAVGGGTAIVIGPIAVPMNQLAVPSVPGVQPVSPGTSAALAVGGPFLFPISGGTLPVGTSYSCLVEGAYDVGFGTGTGSALITGVGDTEVCIVEEAPGAPGIPRFDFRLLETDFDGPFSIVRRGDQAYNSYLAANNDPNETLEVTITSTTNQVARMPMGQDPDNTLFAVSDPSPETDDFSQARQQGVPFGALIPLRDPTVPNPGLNFVGFLPPHELTTDTLITRPHGMCADGSCSEALIKGVGTFSNGDLALGCAGTAIVVEDVPADSHQCEITDTLQTADTVDSQWSRARFDNDPHMTTHFAGNLDPAVFGAMGTQTTGPVLADLFGIIGFPPVASDYLRTENAPNSVNWSVDGFDQATDFRRQHMDVNINNLNAPEYTIRVPLIARDGQASNLNIDLDAGNDFVRVIDSDADQLLYEGPFTQLVNSPPAGISIDQSTYREINKAGIPSQPLLGTVPLSHAALHAPADPPDNLNVEVLDPRNNQGLSWNASSDNNLVTLTENSGNAGEDIILNYDPATIASAPDVTIAIVEVVNAQALNSPVFFPIAVRNSAIPDLMIQDINYGLSGTWYDPRTPGQGLLFDFKPDDQFSFGADFSFDSINGPGNFIAARSADSKVEQIDVMGQRWFTSQGSYRDNRAELTIFQTRNGVFDDPAPVETVAVGSMDVEFRTCTEATLIYDMPGFGLSGVMSLSKLLGDEICTQINDGDIVVTQGKSSSAIEADMQDINYGMIGSWFNPLTPGQGFLFDFITATQFMFVAAFTFDTISPQSGGNIPGEEQRWFTAQGNYAGSRADLKVSQTTGGAFDDPTAVSTVEVGTMIIDFSSCTSADVTYDLPGFALSGVIPVTKLLADEICTQMAQQSFASGR